ncbi:response regulator [Segetibacter sp. 3557_3]|uniref:LytR/AlgR family response regulator transcription factor n=1 Tax=Segetibacter sp. 3557_3 TaxID=2547429 RepID=UPI0010590868|nr:LytTR family transcriptional regulator DNA-binding domain-containing protein [Segetibacter sp. 3557_3]TDH23023.1 response regulator [Segetibacter sp. 3557_3]
MKDNRISVLVVGDRAGSAHDLAAGLQQEGYYITGIARNTNDALSLFRNNKVDLLLLHIDAMELNTGMETTLALLKLRKVPVICLGSAASQAVMKKVSSLSAVAFIKRPFTLLNVCGAIEVALNNFTSQHSRNDLLLSPAFDAHKPGDNESFFQVNDTLFIRQSGRFVKAHLGNILYVQAENNHINLVTKEQKYLLPVSLQYFQNRISYKSIVRIHRFYLVNATLINSFNDTEVQVHQTRLPMGRSYRDNFVEHLQTI